MVHHQSIIRPTPHTARLALSWYIYLPRMTLEIKTIINRMDTKKSTPKMRTLFCRSRIAPIEPEIVCFPPPPPRQIVSR